MKNILRHNLVTFALAGLVTAIIMHVSISVFYNAKQADNPTLNIAVIDGLEMHKEENQLKYLGLNHLSHTELKKLGFICSDLTRAECEDLLKRIYNFSDDYVILDESGKGRYFTIYHTVASFTDRFNPDINIKDLPSNIIGKKIDCDTKTKLCSEDFTILQIILRNLNSNDEGDQGLKNNNYTVDYILENSFHDSSYKVLDNKNSIITIENSLKTECGKHIYKVNLETQTFEYEFDYHYGCPMDDPKL